jgi:hypothetical protein
MPRFAAGLSVVAALAVCLSAFALQTTPTMPFDQVRPGMVGVGRTVFANDVLEEFKVNIIGVLRNVMGPKRNLILARLEGGPLANTGVIQGMSGSPVYVDGRLVGAVSYSLGSFPKEAIAGITPIEEMTSAVDDAPPSPTATRAALGLTWPATSTEVFAALSRLAARAAAPLGVPAPGLQVLGPASLADLAPQLRPIGAAFVMSGFDPTVAQPLGNALGQETKQSGPSGASPEAARGRLRPGDAVGMSLVRGDFESGATGTVTHVAGNRVYAFGHPFLNLGSATMAMTQAHVVTVLPSLDSSMKIASLGSVIGTITQDRATAVGGNLGAGPKELEVRLTMRSTRAPERQFTFYVLNDPTLTPLFTYVSVLNSLVAYERQAGVLAISAKGTATFGADGQVSFDDAFSGEQALTAAAAAIAGPIGSLVGNEFRTATAERLTVEIDASETQRVTTIERAWLDTVRPELGGSYTLQVQLRDYRGARRTVSVPIVMPRQADGPLTILVADAPTLAGLEQRELKPAKPSSWSELVRQVNALPRNNRLYVRLITNAAGTAVGGDTLSSLPGTVQSALQADATVAKSSVNRTVVGAWDQRLDMAVRGSRELSVTLRPAR